jgi:SAM-dependent methyltransferase
MIAPADLLAQAPLDWNERWREAAAQRWQRTNQRSQYWNRRAASFGERSHDGGYARAFFAAVTPEPGWTVLDVGCGSGTLALPLAGVVREVTAMDFSEGMIEQLRRRTREQGITNVKALHAAWEDDWDQAGIGTYDVAIASRSLVVEDLEAALRKLDRAARKRVYITSIVGDGPRDRRAMEAVGRPFRKGPDYIYVYNLLHQMGIYANITILETDREWTFNTPEEAQDHYEQLIEDLNTDERARLRTYLGEHLVPVPGSGRWLLRHRAPIKWALIGWRKAEGGRPACSPPNPW